MSMQKKKALLECGCGCGEVCPGCCFPVDVDGNPIDLPFTIDAPGCPDIDGLTGVFNPLAVANSSAPCGICGDWGYSLALSIEGRFWNPAGPGDPCDLIDGCTITICMLLTCSLELGIADDPSQGACCRRLRMQVSTTYEFEGATYGASFTCLGGTPNWSGVIAPESCSCDGGLSVVFPLGILNPLAQENPECGLVQPCVPNCDMSGIRVVI